MSRIEISVTFKAPMGITATLATPSINPVSGTLTDIMTVSAPTGTSPNDYIITVTVGDVPVGEYTINITDTDSNGNTATAQVEVDVSAGFTLNASPQSLTIPPGGSSTSSITAVANGSESGSLTLSSKVFGSNGLVSDGSVGVSFSPSSVSIGGSTPSIATVSVGSSVALGSTYSIWVYGQDSGGTKSGTSINLTVGTPTLKVRTNPTASVVAGGSSVSQSVVVTSSGGLQGKVTLTVSIVPTAGGTSPTGLTVNFTPASASIDSNDDPITSIATITATSSVPIGTYTATVTATNGSLSAVTTISITVSTYSLSLSDNGWNPNGSNLSTGQVTSDGITAAIQPNVPPGASVTYSWSANAAWFSLDNAFNGASFPYLTFHEFVEDVILAPTNALSAYYLLMDTLHLKAAVLLCGEIQVVHGARLMLIGVLNSWRLNERR